MKAIIPAPQWVELFRRVPKAGASYLIAASYDGMFTGDVAFYNGRNAAGEHWWTLGNIDILPKHILYWSELNLPEVAA